MTDDPFKFYKQWNMIFGNTTFKEINKIQRQLGKYSKPAVSAILQQYGQKMKPNAFEAIRQWQQVSQMNITSSELATASSAVSAMATSDLLATLAEVSPHVETMQRIPSPDFSHMVTCIQSYLNNVQPALEVLKGVPFSAWEELDREITELEVSDEGQANINNILWENFSNDLREHLIAMQISVSEKITERNITVLIWFFELLIPNQTDLSVKQTLESIKQALYCILIMLAVIPKESE